MLAVAATMLSGCVALALPLAASPSSVAVLWDTQAHVPSGDEPRSARLNGIVCAGPAACVAYGSDLGAKGFSRPLLEVGIGSAWSPIALPLPPGATPSQDALADVQELSCAGPDFCAAVIAFADTTGRNHYLVDTLVAGRPASASELPASIGLGDTKGGEPAGEVHVSCWSAGHCVAAISVGDASVPGFEVFRSDGGPWSRLPTPPVDATHDGHAEDLTTLACAADGFCAAAGFVEYSPASASAEERAWVAELDGSHWHSTLQDGLLNSDDVACPSAGDCLVLQGTDNAAVVTRLAPGAPPSRFASLDDSEVEAFACSTARCVSAGTHYVETDDTADYHGDLAVSANGSSRTVQADPHGRNLGLGYPGSVACPASARCFAVGGVEDDNVTGDSSPLIEVLDHGSWTATSPALPQGVKHGVLRSIACPTASLCVAIGAAGEPVRP